ncbi:unnamed protein product [Paramecium sonneborni]|uniref:Uncharacterized protein n=1 Tax=Paramecium sonneborni TaxID=65129 RepID=A0A8S1LVY2_9CILI|nr:unnamed protein product [Paramecium sonneborni]
MSQIFQETFIITFYDLDLPQHQSVKSYKINKNTTLQDCKTWIQSKLDDNYEVYFFLENNKHYTGNLNENVFNILKKMSKRQIPFKKVLSYTRNSNYSQNSQNIEQNKQNYESQKINQQNNVAELNISNNFSSKQNQSYYQEKKINFISEQQMNQYPKSTWNGIHKHNYVNTNNKIDNQQQVQTFPQQSINMININSQQKQEIQNKMQFQPQTQQNDLQQQINENIRIKQEKEQLESQNSQMIKEIQDLKKELQIYEKQIRDLQINIQDLTKEHNNEKMKMNQLIQQLQLENLNKTDQLNQISMYSNQTNQTNKINDENQKLKNENQNLLKQIQDIKFQSQQQIESLNRDLQQYKNQFQMKYQNQDQQYQVVGNLQQQQNSRIQSQLIQQSQYSTQCIQNNQIKVQKQDNYKNKCGHYFSYSQIEDLVQQALMKKQLAKCNQCLMPLQSKLCLLIQSYGETYLQTKNQSEFQLFLSDLERKLNIRGKLVKCSTLNCDFYCVWQQRLDGKYYQQQPAFCPNCLTYCVLNNQQQAPLSQTQYSEPKKFNYPRRF